MVNKRCVCVSFGSLAMLLGAGLIVVLGGILKPFIVEPLIEQGVKDTLYLKYNSYNEEDRNEFRLEMKNYDFYYFNVTNYVDISNRVFNLGITSAPKPNLQQLGPYTYRYYEFKEDVVVTNAPEGDEIISYRIWWIYNPVVGNNDNVDTVCTINPLWMGALNQAWQASYRLIPSQLAALGYDEFGVERQLFALFLPQIPALVIPTVVNSMVPQMGIPFIPAYLGAAMQTLMLGMGQTRDAILTDWRTQNISSGYAALNPALTGFELDSVRVPGVTYLPGPTVTDRLFGLATDYSMINATGWSQWVVILQSLARGVNSGPAFDDLGTKFVPDIVTDLIAENNTLTPQQATPIAVALVPALIARVATWAQVLSTVTPTTNRTHPFTGLAFAGLASVYPPAASFQTWSDFAYAQLAQSAFSQMVGLGTAITLPPPLVPPIVTPMATSVLNFAYDPNDLNIRFYGLELTNLNLGVLSFSQAKSFWADFAFNGTKIYATLLGAALNPVPATPLSPVELFFLSHLNSFGFNFNLTNAPHARRQSLVFTDYLGSIVTTYVMPQIKGFNSGMFTCRRASQFTKGFVDAGLGGLSFPGFFSDTNQNYTGAFRALYTGKDNADIARFYYSRNNLTSFRTLANLGRASECPLNTSLVPPVPVCNDIWTATPTVPGSGIAITVKGSSTFSFFGPFKEDKDPEPLSAFNSDLLRTVNLSYTGEEFVKGIRTRKYALAREMLQDSATNPANAVFRMTREGVAPMKFASPLWGLSLSRPHFADAVSSVRNTVNGLDLTHDDQYQTYVWVEPLTGAVFQGTKKLQGSFHIKAASFDERLHGRIFNNSQSEYFWPAFWANEYGSLNDSQASDFKDAIVKNRDLANLLSPIGYGVGAGIFVIGLAMIIYGCKASASGSTQLKSSTTL